MKSNIRKKVVLLPLLTVLLAISPFLITPLLNNVKNQNYLERILSIELPPDANAMDYRRSIHSNRGDCVHFVSISMATSFSLSELLIFWKEDDALFRGGLDLILKEQEHDTILWIPFELSPVRLTVPVNLSVYGNNVHTGINELLAEGREHIEGGQRLVILFAIFQDANTFDVRCY